MKTRDPLKDEEVRGHTFKGFWADENNRRGLRVIFWLLVGAATGFAGGDYFNDGPIGVGIGAVIGLVLAFIFDEKWYMKAKKR